MRQQMNFSKTMIAACVGCLLLAQPMSAKISELPYLIGVQKNNNLIGMQQNNNAQFKDWKKHSSKEGRCSAHFPKVPEHIRQRIPMKGEEKELQYYVYVSDYDRKEVFMLLIAEYPGVVSEELAVKNLEHFLNTLIAQNSNNKLLFADLIKINGYPGMDFFIQSDQVYFKGRAIQANNTLYLLAMECEVPHYSEEHCKYFIESFELDQ